MYGILRESAQAKKSKRLYRSWVGDGQGTFWRLVVFPKGFTEDRNENLSVFVLLEDTRANSSKSEEDSVQAQVFLIKRTLVSEKMLSASNDTTIEKTKISHLKKYSIGSQSFISLQQLRDSKNGYVESCSGSVIFGVTIYFHAGR